MLKPLGHTDAPDQLLQRELADFERSGEESRAICFSLTLSRYWEDDRDITLGVACNLRRAPGPGSTVALTDRPEALRAVAAPDCGFEQFRDRFGLAAVDLGGPLALGTHRELKPWGSEIWYTGIEQRGVSTAEGVPLPWLLTLGHPHLLPRRARELILLKILAPHVGEVEGDLYFEMHREKVEIYVVTGIDPGAWPGGRGRIRLGFSPERLARHSDRAEFGAAYLSSVRRYREVRDAIDQQLDQFRTRQGFAPGEVVPAEVNRQWLAELPHELLLEEQACRAEMDEFYAVRELAPGDVVRVRPGTPHSLQHGVRVVEFQTPHYERLILSFAQKVLTQAHWDTEEAMQEVSLASPEIESLPRLVEEPGVLVECAARFDEFEVHRVTLQPDARYRPRFGDYALAIGISGSCTLAGRRMGSEEAYLIPVSLSEPEIHNGSPAEAICLLAFPGRP